MKLSVLRHLLPALIFPAVLFYSCGSRPEGPISDAGRPPLIDPDYSGITIPPNIAPLNFVIREKGEAFFTRISAGNTIITEAVSSDGIVSIPRRKWEKIVTNSRNTQYTVEIYVKGQDGVWSSFDKISNNIASETVDQYITYRILYPGYESWKELSIKQRSLESFRENSIIKNSGVEENCVNCHSFNNGKTADFLFHVRGNMGGTYFYKKGHFIKHNLKPPEMKNGAVYPRWHPSGKFVAFSSNKIIQQFHAADNKKIEVSDLESSLVLYDIERNEIKEIKTSGSEKFMDTYPEWSPDGRYLFFCRAVKIEEPFDYRAIHYDLFRMPFDQTAISFGDPEIVFNASEINKSVSFPRISPDGRFAVITLHDYGCFPIWHKEADLYLIRLDSAGALPLIASRMDLNSDLTDSYHSWSSNGRWLVFSSKRLDGLTARPFIAHIDERGKSEKPFIMPQRNPEFYGSFLKSYNIPEFSGMRIKTRPGSIMRAARKPAVNVTWIDNKQFNNSLVR